MGHLQIMGRLGIVREFYVLFQIHTFRHEDNPAGPFADIGLVFVEV